MANFNTLTNRNQNKMLINYNRQSFSIINELVYRYTVYQLTYNFTKHYKDLVCYLDNIVE